MKPNKYLRTKVEELSELFPEINIVYGLNHSIDTHIIRITPAKEFNTNVALEDEWFAISTEFAATNVLEGVTFITDDSSLEIEEVIVEFKSVTISNIYEMVQKLLGEFAPTITNTTFNSTRIPRVKSEFNSFVIQRINQLASMTPPTVEVGKASQQNITNVGVKKHGRSVMTYSVSFAMAA